MYDGIYGLIKGSGCAFCAAANVLHGVIYLDDSDTKQSFIYTLKFFRVEESFLDIKQRKISNLNSIYNTERKKKLTFIIHV